MHCFGELDSDSREEEEEIEFHGMTDAGSWEMADGRGIDKGGEISSTFDAKAFWAITISMGNEQDVAEGLTFILELLAVDALLRILSIPTKAESITRSESSRKTTLAPRYSLRRPDASFMIISSVTKMCSKSNGDQNCSLRNDSSGTKLSYGLKKRYRSVCILRYGLTAAG